MHILLCVVAHVRLGCAPTQRLLLLQVLVLEKNPQVGGNSAKASSGINVINPQAGDTEEVYSKDTLLSGGGLSRAELVEQLVVRRGA